MKVTALIENTAPDAGLRCEHGLALFIEHEGWRCLLDAGASAAGLENAAALGADLSKADAAVLSHGHYDHSGGFPAFFACNGHAPLYLRPQAVEESWHIRKDGERKYLGVPPALRARRDRLQSAPQSPSRRRRPHNSPEHVGRWPAPGGILPPRSTA